MTNEARKPWKKPVLKTITAGSAEKQVNDVTPDGQGNQKS